MMSEERKRILQMVADKKITIDEAERLLSALGGDGQSGREDKDGKGGGGEAKFLRVVVEKKKGTSGGKDDVNIRVPLVLVKAGVKFGRFLPGEAQDKITHALKDKGIDIDLGRIDADSLNELIDALRTTSIDVDSDGERVRIFCE
jgi:hypothetical protein